MQHSRPTLAFKPLIPHLPILFLLPLLSHYRLLLLAFLLHFLLPLSPDCFRILQWNAGGLRARSTELLQFLSFHPVDLTCIEESNHNSSSSFRKPEFSALLSDRIHSRSGTLFGDFTHANNGVIIFIRQSLSFTKLSTSSLSSLDLYSEYVWFKISLSNSSMLSFLNVYAPPIRSYPTNGRTDSFSPSTLSSSRNLFILELQLTSPRLGLKRYFRCPWGGSIRLGHLFQPLSPQ